MFRKTNSLLLLHFTVLLLKLYILLEVTSLTKYLFCFSDAELNNQICVLVSKTNPGVNTHNRCALVKHSANHARGTLTTGLLRTELALEE